LLVTALFDWPHMICFSC